MRAHVLLLGSLVVLALLSFSVPAYASVDTIINPGFETNDFTGWTQVNSGLGNMQVISNTSISHSGCCSAFIGSTSFSGNMCIIQQVTVSQNSIIGVWHEGVNTNPSVPSWTYLDTNSANAQSCVADTNATVVFTGTTVSTWTQSLAFVLPGNYYLVSGVTVNAPTYVSTIRLDDYTLSSTPQKMGIVTDSFNNPIDYYGSAIVQFVLLLSFWLGFWLGSTGIRIG